MPVLNLIVILLVCGVAAGLALRSFFRFRARLELRARGALEHYASIIGDFRRRLLLIDPYASDYMNSLSAQTTKGLLELRQMLQTHERLISEFEAVLVTRDFEKYPQVESLIASLLEPPQPSVLGGDSLLDGYDECVSEYYEEGILRTIHRDWAERFERLLQQVGQEVHQASDRSKDLKLPKGISRRERQPTMLSLAKAGIIEAIRGIGPSQFDKK